MVSTWSSGSTFSPSNFQSMFENSKSDDEFIFVDFLPECLSPAGFFRQAKYEPFRSTVDKANDWLRANPQWELKTCESVQFEESDGVIKTETMTYVEKKDFRINYVRGLRLWLSKRKSDKYQSQQIGYLNIVPNLLKKGGIFKSPEFERMEDIINRYNTIRKNPTPGRIITIETPEIPMESRKEIDLEKSNWYEVGDRVKEYIFIIRIFFEISELTEKSPFEEIGIMDFIPNLVNKGGIVKLPKYDTFSNALLKATDWCSKQTGIRICKAQSVTVNLKEGRKIDTQQTHYRESGSMRKLYVRILRLTYTKCPPLTSKFDVNPISELTCKTFIPNQTSRSIFLPDDFESLSETKARVSAWIKATGAEVICAETLAIRLNNSEERFTYSEESLTFNRPDWNEYWIFIIRVYMEGIYKEPPLHMLPPLPIVRDKNSCNII